MLGGSGGQAPALGRSLQGRLGPGGGGSSNRGGAPGQGSPGIGGPSGNVGESSSSWASVGLGEGSSLPEMPVEEEGNRCSHRPLLTQFQTQRLSLLLSSTA